MSQKTAVIYLRVSSVQQARKELPVESQLQHAQTKAKALGATVVAIFTDAGLSGRSDKRADFQEAIAYCEQHKPDYFIAWDTARFARNRIDAALYKRELRKHGTDVVYVSMSIDSKTDEGWFVEALLEVMDESTSRRISKDTKRSMIKNAEEGFFNGGRVPFGYQTAAEGNRKRVVILETEAVTVREIFAMAQRGMGALSIAVSLNNGGVLNRGRKWAKSTIINLLQNQAYAGYTIFNRRKHHCRTLEPESSWIRTKSRPAIIEEDIFMGIQRQIAGRAPVLGAGSPKSGHMFTGLLKCGECGAAMHIESATGRAKQYFYYRCGEAKRGGACAGRRLSA
ncbi:MAG: Recombinase family protein, partial [Tardiphaga sp.]|nr:Recombinase family protein [Tardiphaga sp.]